MAGTTWSRRTHQPAMKADMPGFAGKLSDEEIRAVLAYIRSRWSRDVLKLRAQMFRSATKGDDDLPRESGQARAGPTDTLCRMAGARAARGVLARIFDMLGWTEMIFNHITVRVPGPEVRFLINPFGLHYREVKASNLVLIDTEGNAVRETKWPVNRAGFVIHSAIHGALSDAHCVMHTHTTTGVAVASLKEGLSPNNFYGAMLVGQVAYHEFEGITVEPGEKERLVNDHRQEARGHPQESRSSRVGSERLAGVRHAVDAAARVRRADRRQPPGRSIRSGPRCSRRPCARAVPPRSAPARTCSPRCSARSIPSIRRTGSKK